MLDFTAVLFKLIEQTVKLKLPEKFLDHFFFNYMYNRMLAAATLGTKFDNNYL